MKFLTLLVMMLCLCGRAFSATGESSHEELLVHERTRALPACDQVVKHRALCERVREAEERAASMTLEILEVTERRLNRSGKPVVRKSLRRQVGLVARNPSDGSTHDIIFDMPIVGDLVFQPRVTTPGYSVKRIKGTSYLKMGFEVMVGEQPLLVLAAQHLSIPPGTPTSNLRLLRQRAERRMYLATPAHLADQEFSDAGREFALSGINIALRILRERAVPSRAYPGALVADKIPAEVLLALIATEQIDPCLLNDPEPGCKHLILKNPFVNNHQTVNAVLAQFFWSGYRAYSDICSNKGACGTFQFTNKRRVVEGVLYLGTYEDIRVSYPKAQLDPVFVRGAQGFVNSAMAAALLVDKELSYPRTPQWVREAFVRDYRVGMICPGTAYNAGAGECRKFARLFDEYQRQHRITETRFEAFPWWGFLDWTKESRTPLIPETHGYLEKLIMLFQHHEFPRPK